MLVFKHPSPKAGYLTTEFDKNVRGTFMCIEFGNYHRLLDVYDKENEADAFEYLENVRNNFHWKMMTDDEVFPNDYHGLRAIIIDKIKNFACRNQKTYTEVLYYTYVFACLAGLRPCNFKEELYSKYSHEVFPIIGYDTDARRVVTDIWNTLCPFLSKTPDFFKRAIYDAFFKGMEVIDLNGAVAENLEELKLREPTQEDLEMNPLHEYAHAKHAMDEFIVKMGSSERMLDLEYELNEMGLQGRLGGDMYMLGRAMKDHRFDTLPKEVQEIMKRRHEGLSLYAESLKEEMRIRDDNPFNLRRFIEDPKLSHPAHSTPYEGQE